MSDTQRTLAAPETNVENKPFFDGAADGKLLIKHCSDCGENHFYPRAICPHCFSGNTTWSESLGKGVIYSFSVMRRVPQPYAIAYVTLDDGVTVMTNIVDCDLDTLSIGQKVKVVFRKTGSEIFVPAFVPV